MLWAIVSNNCSIPGAEAAPIQCFIFESDAREAFESGAYPTGTWVEKIPHSRSYLSEATGEWTELPELYVMAVQETNRPESYINLNTEVGFFEIPSHLEPYQWAKVPFIQSSILEKKLEYEWAWVCHNGKGEVYGESCHQLEPVPSEPLEEADFDLPSDCENYTCV